MNKILKISALLFFIMFLASVAYTGVVYIALEDIAKSIAIEIKSSNTRELLAQVMLIGKILVATAALALLAMLFNLFSANRQNTQVVYVEKAAQQKKEDKNKAKTEQEIEAEQQQKLQQQINDFEQQYKQLTNKTDQALLTLLCDILQAGQGLVWQVDENQKAKPTQSYALLKANIENLEVNTGEGLVGQAIASKTLITVNQVPENYFELATGLGSTQPKALMIMPVKNAQQQVNQVVELALFAQPDKNTIKLAQSINETLNLA